MRRRSIVRSGALGVVVTLALIGPAYAQTTPETAQTLRKLSRGLANAVAGILTIPVTIQQVGQREGPVAGMSWGLFLGLGAAVTRTLVGIAEVLTFPIPLPEVGYGPLIQPEFLLQP